MIEYESLESIIFFENISKLLVTPDRIAQYSECEELIDEISTSVQTKSPLQIKIFDNRNKYSKLKVKYIIRVITKESLKNLSESNFLDIMMSVLFQARLLDIKEIGVYLFEGNDRANSAFLKGSMGLFGPSVTTTSVERLVFVNRDSVNYALAKAVRLYMKPEDIAWSWTCPSIDPFSRFQSSPPSQLSSPPSHLQSSQLSTQASQSSQFRFLHASQSSQSSQSTQSHLHSRNILEGNHKDNVQKQNDSMTDENSTTTRRKDFYFKEINSHTNQYIHSLNSLNYQNSLNNQNLSSIQYSSNQSPNHQFPIMPTIGNYRFNNSSFHVGIASFNLLSLNQDKEKYEIRIPKILGVIHSLFYNADILFFQGLDTNMFSIISSELGPSYTSIFSKSSNQDLSHLTLGLYFKKARFEKIDKREEVLIYGGIHQCILLQTKSEEKRGKKFQLLLSNVLVETQNSFHQKESVLQFNPFGNISNNYNNIQGIIMEISKNKVNGDEETHLQTQNNNNSNYINNSNNNISNLEFLQEKASKQILDLIYSMQQTLLVSAPYIICGLSHFEGKNYGLEFLSSKDHQKIWYSKDLSKNLELEIQEHSLSWKEFGSDYFPQYVEFIGN